MVHELPRDRQTENDESPIDASPDDRRTAENTLVIRGDPYDVTSYQITVSEQIEPDAGSSNAAETSSRSRAVEDAVRDGRRRYAFRGSITDLRVDGPAEILVNGEPFAFQSAVNAE